MISDHFLSFFVCFFFWVFFSFIFLFFSSPEPKAHRWAFGIPMVRRPSVVRPSVHIFKHLLRNRLSNQSQILCGASVGRGNESLFAHLGHMTKMAATPIYGEKPFKNLLLRNRWTDFHETRYVALGTPAHHSWFKWWPWADLNLFYGKVKFCNLGFFIEKKMKTVDFSETIAASDLKIGRSRHLIKFMKVCE